MMSANGRLEEAAQATELLGIWLRSEELVETGRPRWTGSLGRLGRLRRIYRRGGLGASGLGRTVAVFDVVKEHCTPAKSAMKKR